VKLFEGAQRPVILLGHGLRLAGGADLAPKLLTYGIPVLSSWQACDMLDSNHPLNFGRPGIYGQRCANKVLAAADMILAIGNRMAIWNCGYEPLPGKVTMVDIDAQEVAKVPGATWIKMDAREFVDEMLPQDLSYPSWLNQCKAWREMYPWVESPTHDDPTGFISPYRVMEEIQSYLRPDEVIVTDMGTALICAHQVLRLKPPQRIMTSGGMGEMGVALPAAIGASFARGKGRVICLHCDGGMMMNLQELATIAHHQLPVKIIVFSNDGYAMIKHTQRVLGLGTVAVNAASGVSFPDFVACGESFGIPSRFVSTWKGVIDTFPGFFADSPLPSLLEVQISPTQPLVPKLNPIRRADGTVESPKFDQLSPEVA
jgi:acetolactate synthase-1/2/3 large subunit